jgi:hypothetical protein
VEERATVVDELDEPATVTITLPVVQFTRLCGGRASIEDFHDLIGLDGDADLGERVLSNLAYTV